jgi:hypothetical protein
MIEDIEKVEKNSGPSVITPKVLLNAIPDIKNRNPNQKITFPNGVCFFMFNHHPHSFLTK